MTGTCETTRALLLEADPVELAGEGDGPLAAHLRTCVDCRAVAGRLLAVERSLAAALGESNSRRGADEAARRAIMAAHGAGWWRAARWVPVAAAAALALVLLRRDRQVLPPPLPIAPAPAALEVTPPPGRTAAVFQTGDPNIVVVWFF